MRNSCELLLLGTAALTFYLLFGLTVHNYLYLRRQCQIDIYLNSYFEVKNTLKNTFQEDIFQ